MGNFSMKLNKYKMKNMAVIMNDKIAQKRINPPLLIWAKILMLPTQIHTIIQNTNSASFK